MSSATTTTTPGSRPLPPKENALFKRILKCYEQKLYKNGLKFAKQILGNPQTSEHAETLAMKGLILNSMGRREEGKEYVRRGLKNNLRSHTCWHVFGIIQRAERKYDEALKCYRNALRWDPTNLQIMRELSVVQIHIRDLVGYRDTRYQLFQMKPTQRASWIGLAMAYHLLKDYKTAFHILEGFRQTAKEQESCKGFDLEKSELLLYQGTIVEESGNVEGAKQFLLNNDYEIYDKYTYYETVARLCLSLEEFDQAETAYRQLIHMNQENEAYYQGLAKSLKIGDDNPKEVVRMYNSIVEEYPRALLPKRLLLYVTSGEELMTYLKPYLVKHFEKGTPSVFNDLKPSYVNPEKMESIEKLVEDMTASLEKSSRYFEDDEELASPSALMWAYYFLAKHFDYRRQFGRAMDYIEKAIEHTPTLMELLMCKARIFKHQNDVEKAAEWMEEARELDTADRYVNCKSAKYLLRANKVEEASDVCGKFTREGAVPMDNLNEMQCMWFLTECALAYQRTGQFGEALKKCHEIDRHFDDITDDQYDFHTYGLRKMTLKSYMDLLRLEDGLRSHPFYFTAAKCAIEVYIHLHDNPLKSQSDDEKITSETLPASELKKLKNKERKAQKKAELEQQAAAAAAEKKEKYAKSKQPASEDASDHIEPHSEQLNPKQLVLVSDPLQVAIKFLIPLQNLASDKIDTHLLAYAIYSRKDKPLLMLQSIKRAFRVNPDHPKLKDYLELFREAIMRNHNSLPEPLPQFMNQEIAKIYGQS